VIFTVVICTWNRAPLLEQALEQLSHINPPSVPWELIVVNNNCTDATEHVLDRMALRLPLRRVFEPSPGQSHARNAAVRHANGEYIIWTDDDVLVGKDWLRAYADAIQQWPDAAVFGGPVKPKFEGTPPKWMSAIWPDVAEVFGVLDLGTQPVEFSPPRIPYGSNFVVRAREQRQFLYDPNLGRMQGSGALEDEVAVVEAIFSSGGKGWWIPAASVEHWISEERQTIQYLENYFALLGRTWHRLNRQTPGTNWGDRYSLLPKAIYAEIKYAGARLTGNPRMWLKPMIRASMLWGAIRKE
jgi:glycosyltransferase involved in cell wall biosynthesis